MASTNSLLNTVQAVSTVVSRLLPVVEHIPDSFGKWVPPIKAAVAAHQKLSAQIGLASGSAKVLRGRFGAVDAVMAGLNLRTVGASKKMSALGAIGALALSKIIRGFRDSRREAQGLEGSMGRINRTPLGGGIARIAAAVGGYRLLREAAEGFRKALDLGGELSDLKSKTGIAADQMLIIRQAGKDAGVEDLTSSILKMQDALVGATVDGASPAAKAFGALKLQARDLLRLSPVQQFEAIGAALREISNPAVRTALSRDIFGKSGADLLPLVDNADALTDAARAIGSQALLLKQNAERFDVVSDRLGRAGLKLQGFFVGVASTTIPLLEIVTKRMENLDLASQGERFGEGIKAAAEVLTGMWQKQEEAIAAVGDLLMAALLTPMEMLQKKLREIFSKENLQRQFQMDVKGFLSGDKYLFGGGLTEKGLMKQEDQYLMDKNAGRIPLDAAAPTPSAATRSADTAATFRKRARERFAALRTVGAAAIEQMSDAPRRVTPGKPNPFAGFATAFSSSPFSSSGLRGASMAGTLLGSPGSGAFDFSKVANLSRSGVRGGPILTTAERRAFEDQRVASGATRSGSTEGAFAAVRAGDAARRKNVERERERERQARENSVAKSNELLAGILKATVRTADEFD